MLRLDSALCLGWFLAAAAAAPLAITWPAEGELLEPPALGPFEIKVAVTLPPGVGGLTASVDGGAPGAVSVGSTLRDGGFVMYLKDGRSGEDEMSGTHSVTLAATTTGTSGGGAFAASATFGVLPRPDNKTTAYVAVENDPWFYEPGFDRFYASSDEVDMVKLPPSVAGAAPAAAAGFAGARAAVDAAARARARGGAQPDSGETFFERPARVLYVADLSGHPDGTRINVMRTAAAAARTGAVNASWLDLSCSADTALLPALLDGGAFKAAQVHRPCMSFDTSAYSTMEQVRADLDALRLLPDGALRRPGAVPPALLEALEPVLDVMRAADVLALTNGGARDFYLTEVARLAGVPVRLVDLGAHGPWALPPDASDGPTAYTAPSRFVARHGREELARAARAATAAANDPAAPRRRPQPVYVLHPAVADAKLSPQWAARHCADVSGARAVRGAPSDVVFMWVGRVKPNKGPMLFVHAAAALLGALAAEGDPAAAAHAARLRFAVVGEGELEGELKALCARLGVLSHFSFSGYVDNDALPCYLANADAFVFTSLCTETFGMVSLEAQLMGLPVLSVNVGGVKEYCKHGVTCLLVEPRKGLVEALAGHMYGLATDADSRARLGDAGRSMAKAVFAGGRQGQRAAKLYLHLLRGAGVEI